MGDSRRLWKTVEWDLLAVIIASLIGIALHVLGILPESYVISLILILLCLHALHEIGHQMKYDEAHDKIMEIDRALKKTQPDIELISRNHFARGEEFALKNKGAMWWFNTPMRVLKSQEVFDRLLKSAIDNPKTKRIEFILKPSTKGLWEKEVWPKIEKCRGREKVQPPIWREIKENLAFKMIDLTEEKEIKEAHLTFWGEPFTMELKESNDTFPSVYHPRFILQVRNEDLLSKLKEIFIQYKSKQL